MVPGGGGLTGQPPERVAYRPEYVAALNLLARACRIVLDRGLPAPILVGGAVVEFDTVGTMFSEDSEIPHPR